MYKRSFKTRTIIFPISAHVVSILFAKEVLDTACILANRIFLIVL